MINTDILLGIYIGVAICIILILMVIIYKRHKIETDFNRIYNQEVSYK